MKQAVKQKKIITVCNICGEEIKKYFQCGECLGELTDEFYCLDEFERLDLIANRHICKNCFDKIE